jgi:hypothetical protein
VSGVLVGGCGCGTVRYRVADAFLYGCNLSLVTLSRGDRICVQTVRGTEREKLEITDGRDALLVFGDDLNDTGPYVGGGVWT